ncbi:MAG: NifU family protein [Bacteroidia bacterium]|nr:NifU family protein [Bacteroidia bacterium]
MSELKHVNIYMEATPNPSSMKFVADQLLLKNGSVEYLTQEEAVNCPLAVQLLKFTGVKSVFITSNFISVNKAEDIEWMEIQSIIREFIRSYLVSGDPIFTSEELLVQVGDSIKKENTSNDNVDPVSSSPEIEKKIIDLLEEFVRPAVEKDGGAIEFGHFKDGVVTLDLKGACSGCPSSVVTLKNGIENLLTLHLPEVRSVVARDA